MNCSRDFRCEELLTQEADSLTKLQTIQREGASQLVNRTMQRLVDPHFGGECETAGRIAPINNNDRSCDCMLCCALLLLLLLLMLQSGGEPMIFARTIDLCLFQIFRLRSHSDLFRQPQKFARVGHLPSHWCRLCFSKLLPLHQ